MNKYCLAGMMKQRERGQKLTRKQKTVLLACGYGMNWTQAVQLANSR